MNLSKQSRCLLLLLTFLFLSTPGVRAALSDVVDLELVRRPYARWDLIVSLNHEDRDRSHFCDRIEGLDQDGKRVFQGHFYAPVVKDVEEDGPVRRRLRPVPLPPGVTRLTVRAHCKQSGWGGKGLEVDLAVKEGPGYRIRARPNLRVPDFEGIEGNPNIRTWRKRYLRVLAPVPSHSLGPVPEIPPDPLDRRPQGRGQHLVLAEGEGDGDLKGP